VAILGPKFGLFPAGGCVGLAFCGEISRDVGIYLVLRALRAVFAVFVKHVLAERRTAGFATRDGYHVQSRTERLRAHPFGPELE